jgi:hypothetical protein
MQLPAVEHELDQTREDEDEAREDRYVGGSSIPAHDCVGLGDHRLPESSGGQGRTGARHECAEVTWIGWQADGPSIRKGNRTARAASSRARDRASDGRRVRSNNDTLYVLAACDVRQGPLVLHVPDTGGRYYVLQFVDAWTNNFAYIGRRATGTSEGECLLAADGWAGEAPAGMRLFWRPPGSS